MKVLLTGATGLLGRHIVSELLRQGIVPRLLLHRHTFARNALPVETEIFWGNLSDPSCVDAILSGVDAVIHCAWAFNGANTPRPTVNEVSSRDLCERALRKGVTKFAFVSSVAVYGMSGNGGTVCSEISELCGEKEPFIYPQEKVSVEKQLVALEGAAGRVAIFRPGPIFDDEKGPAKKTVRVGGVHLAIGMGNGRNRMAYIHAADVARAIVQWLTCDATGGTFNLVADSQLTMREWMQAWGCDRGEKHVPLFMPELLVVGAAKTLNLAMRLLGRTKRVDVTYALACAKRDLQYSGETAKTALGWTDSETQKCVAARNG